MNDILRAEALTVGYGSKAVVESLTLRAEAGKLLTLIGPNGAGKTTVLKALLRQLDPLGGTVWLSEKELSTLSQPELARLSAAVLTERPRPELMRCRDVVAAGRYPHTGRLGILSERDRAVVNETIRLVGLEEIAEDDFERISDGQRQRVMLARALCQEPKLMVLDEPTSFLDIRNKLDFLYLLRMLAREKRIAVVMSLHELDLAQKFSDEIVCIRDGRADRIGTPEEIFSGDYIGELYGVEHGRYEPLFGSVEPEGLREAPQVFVIGGGGCGIPVYRRLHRLGIPFAAGVLHENDLDTPVAKALASHVLLEKAFEPVGREKEAQARELIEQCQYVLCPLNVYGRMNQVNAVLRDLAEKSGKLAPDVPVPY